jgi:hypothetical protein
MHWPLPLVNFLLLVGNHKFKTQKSAKIRPSGPRPNRSYRKTEFHGILLHSGCCWDAKDEDGPKSLNDV